MTEEKSGDRRSGRRWWVAPLLATLALLLLLPCLGAVGGVAHLAAWRAGALSRWRRLKKPPAAAVEFVGGTLRGVAVRAADGNAYWCQHGGTRGPKECWVETELPPAEERDPSDATLYGREVKPPAGAVVDSLVVTQRYAEDWFETRYVLLDNGRVYVWEYDDGFGRVVVSLGMGPLIGIVLAVVAVVLLWVMAGVRRLRRGRV